MADDAQDVLSALRLGWSVAEMRGRIRPGGPPGDVGGMPDHIDHPLPLRIERGPAELRIEVHSVVADLARRLHIEDSADGIGLCAALADQVRLLVHVRAPEAAEALQKALDLLEQAGSEQAIQILKAARADQQALVTRHQRAVAAAQQVLAGARQLTAAGPPSAGAHAAAVLAAENAVELEQAISAGEAAGLAALDQVIEVLDSPDIAAQAAAESIRQRQLELADAARGPWADLAELIWRFDAHAQNRLTATSESQGIGYQLGRGLAETYWALDPAQVTGSASWSFLLSERRCGELSRMTGRLAAYMGDYTASAIAGSVEVWKEVARTPEWLGDVQQADRALYSQIRRWYELIILRQDPTTLIGPAALMKNYRTVSRALQLFWPQLVAAVFGLGFLVVLLLLVSADIGTSWEKTLSGILAAIGLSLAGLTGTLKNSAQALLTRLRQDAYTDLVAIAVQTAPPPPKKSDLQNAISRRALTPATPN
jgi:hypothetical protein